MSDPVSSELGDVGVDGVAVREEENCENSSANCNSSCNDNLMSTGTDVPNPPNTDVSIVSSNCHSEETTSNGCNSDTRELVEFCVIYNKQKYDITFPLDDTVESLKQQIEKLTDVPVAMQKIMFKGRMKDDATLRENKVTKGAKIMVVGSTVTDVLSVSEPAVKTSREKDAVESASSKEPLSKQKPHKNVLDKYGKPEDAMPGIRGHPEALPPYPISGMYNKSGGKVRLTFKLEANQVWIGTKERTEKVSLGSIKAVVSEPIDGHDEYHLMALQLGPTEASRYWIYWVPAQYVDAIKDAILGNWQYF